MIKMMTLCRSYATKLMPSSTLSFAIFFPLLFVILLLAKATIAQEFFPALESPSAAFTEMQVGQSVLDVSDVANLPDGQDSLEVPEGLSVLTRGPLHEAFASVHQADPQPSALVLKTPPELIDEVPPEYKPDGNNVQWISGYWAWDDAQSDFIWISGIWRDVPPNRRWIPGYWDAEDDGHHWISGLWTEETQLELGYLPKPPASIDQGPSTMAPGEEYFYTPGNWTHQDGDYRWSAGHWQSLVENWIWIPASYIWTPNGCVFQSGYWDYEIERRGTCFAPVQFTQPVYLANNYSYRPEYVINLDVDFMTHLFVRPRCGHYFYGDWYAANFNNVRYRPWVSYSSHFRSYDPLLAYYGHRSSSLDSRYNVVQYLTRQHNFYVNNRDYRPRPTYRSQNKHARNIKFLDVTGSPGPKGLKGHRSPHEDFLRKSSYIRTYRELRTHDDRRHGATVDTRNRGDQQIKPRQHHKVAEKELRDSRRNVEQLAKMQRERKRNEHSRRQLSGKQNVARKPRGKTQSQNNPSTGQRDQEQLKAMSATPRQAAAAGKAPQQQTGQSISRNPSSNPSPNISGKMRMQNIPSRQQRAQAALPSQQNLVRSVKQQPQRDAARRAEQRSQQEQHRRAQHRRAQQEAVRRAQEQARQIQQFQEQTQQQQNFSSPNISGKMRMQNIPSRQQRAQTAFQAQQNLLRNAATQQSQRDAARRAQQRSQQNQNRRAQQAPANRARQQQVRRTQQAAQQQQSRQQAAQRASQQQSRRDSGKRSQQQSQRDSARGAQANRQKSAQKSRKAPAQQSKASRLRNRSISK